VCCVIITRTAGHSVAVCCDLLADLCSLLLPPCMQTIVCVSHSGGSSHSGEAVNAATQWWPENSTIVWPRFQFELCLAFSTRTREQSTGLATAGATRPLEEVEVRDEMREKEGEMRRKKRLRRVTSECVREQACELKRKHFNFKERKSRS